MPTNINDSILGNEGWVHLGSIIPVERDNGHIILYSSYSCINRVHCYMSNNIDLSYTKYTRIKCSGDYYELPCLFMFVTEGGRCSIQIAPRGLKDAIEPGIARIIENGQESNGLSINRDVAMALDNNVPVSLYYWPILDYAEPYLLEHKDEFNNTYIDPEWTRY